MNTTAFPTVEDSPHGGTYVSEYGMTQRQYYKAQALAGLMANTCVVGVHPVAGWGLRVCDTEDVAVFCGNVADAMIAEDAKHAKAL